MSDGSTGRDKPQAWIDGADEALRIAEQQLDSGRHLWAIFFCHLTIEKMLKAAVINRTGEAAPKTHNLRYLTGLAGMPTDHPHFEFISKLSDLSVPTRYPEDLMEIGAAFTKDVAKQYTLKAREVMTWIGTRIGL